MNQNILPFALLLSILILGGGYLFLNTPIKPQKSLEDQNLYNFNISKILSKEDIPLGNPNAPVKIIVFSDFQCPHCKNLYFETIKKIKEDYINKGLVVLYYKHFVIGGIRSLNAALASKCAAEENKYWEYIDLLFESQSTENTKIFEEDNLVKLAEKLKLNKEKFEECLKNKKYLKEIEKDINLALSLKINGTPSTIINNDFIQGALPYSEFQQVINKYLTQ